MSPEWLSAAADVVGALAWPIVAVVLVLRYRDNVGRLIDRLRRGGGAEFDPVPPPQREASSDNETGFSEVAAVGAAMQLRSESLAPLERAIRTWAAVADQTSPEARVDALVTVAARMWQLMLFERIDGQIWGTQVALLDYLNALPEAIEGEVLKESYYEEAVRRLPAIAGNYRFESYMGFLVGHDLVSQINSKYKITETGHAYLQWRIAQRRPPRAVG